MSRHYDPNRKTSQQDGDTVTLSDASKHLKSQTIPQLVHMLDDLQVLPIDSESLTKLMHEHGINMRYLSHICVLTQMPHVLDLCVTEMLARTAKRIINKQMSELILENKLEARYLQELKSKNEAE